MEAPRDQILRKVGEWLAPGEDLIVTDEEARRAVSMAEQVRSRVRAALRELGMESS